MIADKAVQSLGPLFTNPDPDEARKYFHSKSRTKAGKLMSLRQAVERFVHDGDYLALGRIWHQSHSSCRLPGNRAPGTEKYGICRHTSTHDSQIVRPEG